MRVKNKDNYYILVASTADGINGKRISSYDMMRHRLDKNSWPMFKGTSHMKKIEIGDKVVFYLAGNTKSSQNFVSSAEIQNIVNWDFRDGILDVEDALTPNPEIILKLRNITLFPKAISIRPLVKNLNFIKKPDFWGLYMQSGCISITEKDFILCSS